MKNLTKQTIRIYWEHVRRYPWALFLILFGVIGAELGNLYQPIIYKNLIDTLTVSSIGDPAAKSQLLHYIYQIGYVGLAIWAFWRIEGHASSYMVSRVMSNLLNTSFTYLHDHSYGFFSNSFVGSLVTRVSRFSRSYEKIFDQMIFNVIPMILTTSIVLVVLFRLQPIFGLILTVWTIIYVISNLIFMKYKLRFDVKASEIESLTTGRVADTISNQINLKLFASARKETEDFMGVTDRLRSIRAQAWHFDAISRAVHGLLTVTLELSLMYMAINYWSSGIISIGEVILIQAYIIRIIHNLWGVSRYLRTIFESLADAEEMTTILTKKHDIVDRHNAGTLSVNRGAIEFSKVNFGYHKKSSILKDFKLSIKPGERVALIGQSGGGKTTIVKLLFRFFDLKSGAITIDGQNIAEVTQDSLRQQVALVPQEPILFHRSLLENIRYAKPDATKEEVIEAAKQAHCHEFIMKFPEGYETQVGERGVKLSGGERQRVAIARAILKDAPVLVLDEATSSLDSESERFIQDSLRELMKGRTTIVIAHRLSTIMQMDRIVVIAKGKIVEEGTHKQLLKVKEGTYQKLWGIQAGSFAVE